MQVEYDSFGKKVVLRGNVTSDLTRPDQLALVTDILRDWLLNPIKPNEGLMQTMRGFLAEFLDETS